MLNKFQKIIRLLLVNVAFVFTFTPAFSLVTIPITGSNASVAAAPNAISSVDDFAASITNGNSGQLMGVYAAEKFALTVVQQPSGNGGYVATSSSSVVTQFGIASNYGSIGLLAHNYLAGKYFSNLSTGTTLTLVFGDGSKKNYTVSEIRQYQALNPSNVYSNFVNVNDSSKQLSSTDLFNETYGKSGALVLQTCIDKDGNSSWGRLFVIAYPA